MSVEYTSMDIDQSGATDSNEMTMYQLDDWEFTKQFVILGASRHSDPDLVVKAVSVLDRLLLDDKHSVQRFINIIKDISENGQNINQTSLFICLVKCYMFSTVSRSDVGEVINSLCRIPTQLFLFLKMLKEFTERREQGGEDTADYYKELLRSIGSNTNNPVPKKGGKRKGPGKTGHDTGCINIKSFISKHKFIARWYSDPKKRAVDLLLLLTKYPKRYDWDHKTLCKYSHVKINPNDPENSAKNLVLDYHMNGFKKIEERYQQHIELKGKGSQIMSQIFQYIGIFEEAKKGDAENIAGLISNNRRECDAGRHHSEIAFTYNTPPSPEKESESNDVKMTRLHLAIEHLPAQMYKKKEVWEELIKDMPMIAMLKHVSHIASLGLFKEKENMNTLKESENVKDSEEKSKENVNALRVAFSNESRIYPFTHPFQIFKALVTYKRGFSFYKNDKKWEVNEDVSNILLDAFATSLKRTEKNMQFDNCILCIDKSHPMSKTGFLGFDQICACGAAVALATVVKEMGVGNSIYSCGDECKEFKGTLRNCCEVVTKCEVKANLAEPIKIALEKNQPIDAFILFTLSKPENICGSNPYETFLQYKLKVNNNAKLVICAMEASNSFIANPNDPNVVIVCGADADVLPLIYKKIYCSHDSSLGMSSLDCRIMGEGEDTVFQPSESTSVNVTAES